MKNIDQKSRKNSKTDSRSRKIIGVTIIVFSALALLASVVLTVDLIQILRNPNLNLSCNINPIIACQSVMKTWQADLLFGVPNSLFGVAAFAVTLTFGVLILARVKLPRWLWICLWIGLAGGAIFAIWMISQLLYSIGLVCPWCLTADISTFAIFGAFSQYILRNNLFEFGAKTNAKIARFLHFDGVKVIVAALILLVFLLIYLRFGNALFS